MSISVKDGAVIGQSVWGERCSGPTTIPDLTENALLWRWCVESRFESTNLAQKDLRLRDVGHLHLIVESRQTREAACSIRLPQVAKVPPDPDPPPVTSKTDIDMDAARDLYRFSHEKPRSPSSADLEDQLLFERYFDWPAFEKDSGPWDYSHRTSPHDLDRLVTDIPQVIEHLHRMKTSFGSEDEAGASPSYSSHPSPPELIQGEGSTSPSDHSGPALHEQFEEYYPSPRSSLKDARAHDDQWTLPRTDSSRGSKSGYAPQMRVLPHGATKYGAQGISRMANPPSSGRSGKRQRQLENPDQTADVRKSGACLPCRLSKTRCHENGVCPTCRKAFPHHSHLICARQSLVEMWPCISRGPDVWTRHPDLELEFSSQARRIFTGRPKPISIFFKAGSPPLHVYAQAFRWQGENEDSQLEKAGLSSEHLLRHEDLQSWVERDLQMRCKSRLDFPNAVHQFLMVYSQYGYGLPKHGLVQKVHLFACFFRIWKTPTFLCQDPSGNKGVALPANVQSQLRTIAHRGMHSIEHDILKELDNLVTPRESAKPEDKLALWASMWQLILIYRELTIASQNWLARAGRSTNESLRNTIQSRYRYLYDHHFPLVCIFYHYQFRMKKSLEISASSLHIPRAMDHAVHDLLDSRKTFLQTIKSSPSDVDQLLCALVVDHEIKKLNARKRPSVKSSRKSSGRGAYGEYDDEAD